MQTQLRIHISCSSQATWLQLKGSLHRFFLHASTRPLPFLTAVSLPVTLRSVTLNQVTRLSPEENTRLCLWKEAVGGSERVDVEVGGWEDVHVPYRGNISTLLDRNLSEPFEIPLVVSGVCVCVCVEIKHGIVSETTHCTELPLLHECMNNWCGNSAALFRNKM